MDTLDDLKREFGVGSASAPLSPSRGVSDLSSLNELDRLKVEMGMATPESLRGSPQGSQFLSQVPEPIRRKAGGALRGLASALEPIQLPQDAMFATIAGAVDPNTTITERLRSMEWGKYAPGGEAPARPANGEEIFTMLGFEGRTAKWAGIAADLTVDPLVAGSFLRVAGKVGGIQDLVKLGDRMDYMVSPLGMGREVSKVARRSQYISDFMDRRTMDLMEVFRNPDSTVLGMRRFGEKSTRALETILPQSQVDRLRFGSDLAQELADARRMAKSSGHALNVESLRMLHRAQYGFGPEESQGIVRSWMNAAEGQSKAFEARLGNLDNTVRDVIEREVYEAIRPSGKEPGIGIIPFMGGQDNLARQFDESTSLFATQDETVRSVVEQVHGAVQQGVEASVRSPRTPDLDDIFGVHSTKIQERLEDARRHVGKIARDQAEKTGVGSTRAYQMEAESVRAFNGYLADTLQIDAKLGAATSGFEFVGNTVRRRVAELNGDLDMADGLWQKVLRRGLLQGEEGIANLKAESTGMSLKDLVRQSGFSADEIVARRQAHATRVAAEVDRIRGGFGAQKKARLETFAAEVEALAERAGQFSRNIKTNARMFPNELFGRGEAQTLQRTFDNTLTRYRQAAADVIEAGDDVAPMRVSHLLQAEGELSRITRRYNDLLANVKDHPAKWFPDRPTNIRPGSANAFLREASEEAAHLSDDLGSMSARRRAAREEYIALNAREAQAVGQANVNRMGREAADAAVPPRQPSPPVGELRIHDKVFPLAGRNTTGEDILALRMRSGKFGGIEEAAEAPITFGELLDGAADMQALPIGEYLSGLMNGHLRRTYALFGDSSDFKTFIDNVRIGTIVPSSLIDEANLVDNMVGFADEAKLIKEYHNLLTRNGRGQILKKSGIAEYLMSSGVDPDRVNGALRAMMQTLGPENGALGDFLNRMDAMVPRYRNMLARRERAIESMGEQMHPRVTDKRFFDPTEMIPQHMLEQLGEIAQARASLGDATDIARRVVTKQEMFQNIYEVGTRRGLIKSTDYVDEFGAKFIKYADGEGVLGGFANKYVHPHLYEELRRASSVTRDRIPYAYTRLRSLITGGFLAAPSVIAANFFGGLYQGATIGINPAVMIRRMIEVTDDVNASSLGYKANIVSEMKRHVDVDLGSLPYQDFGDQLRRVRLDDFGLGPQGVNRAFDDVSVAYEKFLQRPGIGKLRTRFAGLEGFQFTENWFKVAAYKEMKERLTRMTAGSTDQLASGPMARINRKLPEVARRTGGDPADIRRTLIEKEAAEFARTVVFDYSELPTSLSFLKNTGLVLFPGFTYFLAGRTMNAALKRPGSLAVADRVSEAMSNASLGLEEQITLLMGSPDWMKDDQGVPMPFSGRKGPSGEDTVSIIPLNQLTPTSTIWDGLNSAGNPWGESIAGLGLMGPLFEVMRALVTDDGEAVLSARYGNRVFDADAEGGRKMAQIFRFLHNTMAPANVRKMVSVDMEGRLEGVLPSMARFTQDHAGWSTNDMMDEMYSFEERRRRRPDSGWREDVLGFFLRRPQVVALDGPISGFRRELANEQTRLNEELTMIRRRANRARYEGNMGEYERAVQEIERRQNEFNEKWSDFVQFQRAYERRKAGERTAN